MIFKSRNLLLNGIKSTQTNKRLKKIIKNKIKLQQQNKTKQKKKNKTKYA